MLREAAAINGTAFLKIAADHFAGFRGREGCGRQAAGHVRKSRDNAKQTIRKLREITTGSSGEILEDLRAVYPQIRQLAKLVNEFHGIYTEKKKKKSIVDFNDLEHYSLEILSDISDEGTLVPSSTALEYRKKFEEILVDEYQDSNLVQEAIINMISGSGRGPHVFMVGDVKQSIYRFRQARPELFMTKYNTYPSGKGHRSGKYCSRKISGVAGR